MGEKNIHYFKNRTAWKNWLLVNHCNYDELWMLFYKKASDKKGISYSDAVEEAICHGWIDSIIKRLNEETYLRKFTPRKLNSSWSPTNIARAEKMLTAGQMQATGKKAYEHFLQSGKRPVKSKVSDKSIKLPLYLIKVLKKNFPAWTFFNQISPSQQRRYIAWITSPQKTETKYRRLNQAIKKLEHRQLLGLK